ncbi:MAG: N5-glutamine methyltransferase family protein [Acidimicrobiales bacterium]
MGIPAGPCRCPTHRGPASDPAIGHAPIPAIGHAPIPAIDRVAERLSRAGCVAPREEADELVAAAAGDAGILARLVERRTGGEPLAWITGTVRFAGHDVVVHPGVYVPRWQSEPLAVRGAELLPADGLAADLCTGSGAVAVVMARARPGARVLGTDLDPAACRCAAANGVEILAGHLADPIPAALVGRFDVVTAVPPYVPTGELAHLPRDVLAYEPVLALDGGPDGTDVLGPVLRAAAELLRPGGTCLVEVGGRQDVALGAELDGAGLELRHRLVDGDGDLRGIEAARHPLA